MSMKATKKPVEIEYYPLEWAYIDEIKAWGTEERPIEVADWSIDTPTPAIRITTLEGVMQADGKTDVIIRGVKGEVYPCKRSIFDETYTTDEE